jgi:hypothetical protein
MVGRFRFGGWDVSDRLEQTAVIEPVDPFQRRQFDRLRAAARAAAIDHLGPEQAVDGFGERIVLTIFHTANRRPHAWLSASLAERQRGVLGGLKWSSLDFDRGGCGEYSKAAFRSVRARHVAVAVVPAVFLDLVNQIA